MAEGVKLSVEQLVHLEFAKVANEIHKEYGVTVHSVNFHWTGLCLHDRLETVDVHYKVNVGP